MGKILEINGPLVKLELPQTVIGEQVRVGRMGLVGEVIGRDGDTALAQLYEDTAGLRPGEVAEGLGWPLSVELGPGLLSAIFDGVQRPLQAVWEQSGDRIARGVAVPSLPRDKRWHFVPDPGTPGRQRAGGRRRAGHGAGNRIDPAPHPDPAADPGRTAGTGAGRRLHPRGSDRPGQAGRRPHRETAPVPPLAGAHAAPVQAARPRGGAADHRAAHSRYLLPVAEGRQGGDSRPLRRRQDHAAAADRALVQRRDRHLRRLRRARQRTHRRARIHARAEGPAHRPPADGAHPAGGQHLQHAGGGARSLDLRRHHAGRVFPRPGLRRGDGGRLHQPLGRGPARSRRPPRPDAGGGGLSGLSRLAPGGFLRARRAGRNLRRRPRLGDADRRGVAARRRLLRAGHQPHQGNHPDLLGAVEGTRRRPPLPGGRLAGKLLRLREFRCEVVGGKR